MAGQIAVGMEGVFGSQPRPICIRTRHLATSLTMGAIGLSGAIAGISPEHPKPNQTVISTVSRLSRTKTHHVRGYSRKSLFCCNIRSTTPAKGQSKDRDQAGLGD